MQLASLTSPDIAALDKHKGVLILPIGAIEQHGPHLPVHTDTLLATRVLEAALAALPASVNAWMLPTLPYGKSNEHTGFAGTFTLSAATLTAVVRELAESAVASGFRRLAFFNGHGGNVAVLDAAARDIRASTGLMTFCLHPALYVDPPFAITPEERKYGFHAGELETALMLALDPHNVHMDRAVRHFATFPDVSAPLFFFGSASAAWLSRDWSPSGVFGDATLGTREKGEAMLEHAAKRLAAIIGDVAAFEIPGGAA